MLPLTFREQSYVFKIKLKSFLIRERLYDIDDYFKCNFDTFLTD
jgi:hypothetical protein